MKKSAIIILSVGLLLLTFFVAHGDNQPLDKTQNTTLYASIIDATIAKCQNKKALLESRSSNIRRQAIRACLKGAYLKMKKKELVSFLVSIQAEPTPHRVEYHLNKYFYQSIKPDGMVVLLEASQMLGRTQ